MNRRLPIVVAVIVALTLSSALIWATRRPPEPSYLGKPATYWVDRQFNGGVRGYPDTKPFEAMGVAAAPYIAAGLRARNSWRQSDRYAAIYRSVPAPLRKRLPPPRPLEGGGASLSLQASMLLARLRPAVDPALPALGQDRNALVRQAVVVLAANEAANDRLAPGLLFAAATDPARSVREIAARAAAGLTDSAIPGAIAALDRRTRGDSRAAVYRRTLAAIEWLAWRGPRAGAALPELKVLALVDDKQIPVAAMRAIVRIERRPETLACVLNELTDTGALPRRLRAIAALGKCGPQVVEAAPILVKLWKAQADARSSSALDRPSTVQLRRAVAESLKQIAPEVAAREGIR